MIRPTLRLCLLALIPLTLSVLFWGEAGRIVAAADGFIVLMILLDGWSGKRAREIEYRIQMPELHSIGREGIVRIMLKSPLKHEIVKAALPQPEHFELKNHRVDLQLTRKEESTWEIQFICKRRGEFLFESLAFQRRSPLGLLWIAQREKISRTVKIIPDVESVHTFFSMARKNRLEDMGFHRLNMAGSGMELHHLRAYQIDEDARHIDWKASKRLGKPVSKVFSAESSNHVYFVLDTGRMMTTESKGMSLLDYGINGTLLLGNVALKMGDSVGIIAVADEIHSRLQPVKGPGSQKRIMTLLAGLETRYTDTNYRELFTYLHHQIKKRSLIIIFNDSSEGVQEDVIEKYSHLLGQRHMLLFIMIRNSALEEICNSDSLQSEEDFFTRTAAREYANQRKDRLMRLQKKNILVADVLPEQINTTLVNQYLSLRRGNRI